MTQKKKKVCGWKNSGYNYTKTLKKREKGKQAPRLEPLRWDVRERGNL